MTGSNQHPVKTSLLQNGDALAMNPGYAQEIPPDWMFMSILYPNRFFTASHED